LLANPIVAIIAAIVLALTALFKAFQKTQGGADKINDAFKALGAAMDVIVERAAMIFKALGKIFTGKFKEGFDEMGQAVKGVGEELKEAAQAAIDFEKAQRALYESETDVITANAERRQQIAELVFLTRDFTKSIDERRAAIIEADRIEKEILADNIRLQEERVRLQQQEILNTPELQRTREQSRKLAEEEARLIDLQTESLAKQRELKNRLNDLDNQARAAAKAAADEAAKEAEAEAARLAELETQRREQLALENEIELQLQAELDAQFLEMEKQLNAETEKLNQENTEAMIAQAEKRFQKEEELIQQQIENEQLLASVKEGIYQNSVTALLGFLGEGSRIAKAVQVADATRTAIITAMQAYKSAVGIPVVGAVLGPIAAAAALAAGMANVRKIINTPDPTGAAAPATPSVSLAEPQGNVSTDALVNAEQGVPQDVAIIQDQTARRPVKSYVVASDVTAEQEIERKREEDVTI
jgi:hypothetical protein